MFEHMTLLDASHVDEETVCPCCSAVYGDEPNTIWVLIAAMGGTT